jgi:tetrahydromethanopterin S-methyltransferase subunit A
MKSKLYKFHKQTEEINETIKASYDPEDSWHEDKNGYFLIRINPKKKQLEAAFVTRDHVIRKVVYGPRAIDVYYTICKHKLITRMDHAAYLGKELYKAEIAMRYGKRYQQSFPLNFEELKEKIKLKKIS